MSKRGQDTERDASHGMEEIHEFCFKEFAAVCLFWNFFVLWYSCNITYHPNKGYAYCCIRDSLDPMQLLLVLFLTNRKTERIVDIDDHVHAGCRNHTRHNVEDGVLF